MEAQTQSDNQRETTQDRHVGNPGLFFQKCSREATALERAMFGTDVSRSSSRRAQIPGETRLIEDGSQTSAAIGSPNPRLSALLLAIALAYFTLGDQPVLGFASHA